MIAQIYEIQTAQDAARCIELGVDHIGSVILSEDEWRISDIKEVIGMSHGTSAKNTVIPLFEDMTILQYTLDYYRPDYVHFCNSLVDQAGGKSDLNRSAELQAVLKDKFPEIGVMRSIPVPDKGKEHHFSPMEIARVFEPVSDMFLADTWLWQEPVAGFIGITGKTPDWEIARKLVSSSGIPVILAGGLSPENVYDALARVLPAGADSCTKTNRLDTEGKTVRFEKDFEKVEMFVKEIRRFEQNACLDPEACVSPFQKLCSGCDSRNGDD